MGLKTSKRNGTGKATSHDIVDNRVEDALEKLPTPSKVEDAPSPITEELKAPEAYPNGKGLHRANPLVLGLFCYEYPDTSVGQQVARTAQALAKRQATVHLFSRRPFDLEVPGVYDHALGEGKGAGLLDQVENFSRRAGAAFLEQFPDPSQRVALLGHEWSSIPALELLKADRKLDYLLSLNSLERQRSDMTHDLSQRIEEIELAGLQQASNILVQQSNVIEVAKSWVPDCASRLTNAYLPFPAHLFDSHIDPGVVKARFQIGPIDPTILFVGEMDERHGPDVLMKSIPAILKNHPQARFVFVGDGSSWWPMRVHTRYLLLEHAVRLVGHMEGPPLHELIQAADIVVVPSREATEWWPIQAAWAARRPVVTTHATATGLVEHEHDSILVYPHESSLVWGIERLLFDTELLRRCAAHGHEKLEERFGWSGVAVQIEELLGVPQPC